MRARRQIWFGVWWNVPAGLIALGTVLWWVFSPAAGIAVIAFGALVGASFFLVERRGHRPANTVRRRSIAPVVPTRRLAE